MGLITKGLLAAGAVYAVKGVNKSSERRDEKRQQQQAQNFYPPQQQGQGSEFRGPSPQQGGPYSAPQGYGYDNRRQNGQQYRGEGSYQQRQGQGPPPRYQSRAEASSQQQRGWERPVEEGPSGWAADAKR